MSESREPELLALLRRLPHFADLTPELLALLAACAQRRAAIRGDVLCRAGEPGDAFYVITAGIVRILAPTERGEELVAELGPGDWFGEMALLTGEPRSATAVAAIDTRLVVIYRGDFHRLLAEMPTLSHALSEALSRRLRARLQGRPARRPPGLVVAIGAASGPAFAKRLADLAVAFRGVTGATLTVVDHDGLLVGDDTPLVRPDVIDPAALRASHALVLAAVVAPGERAAHFAREADALLVLDDDDASAALSAWLQSVAPDRTAIPVRSTEPRVLRGIARTVLGRRAGLALSAGAAKGLAHIGVLRVFERAGIEFDTIAGTSMGAIVGGFTACGMGTDDLVRGFAALAGDLRRTLLDFGMPEVSLLRGQKKRTALQEHAGDRDIRDLALPFRAVAADLVSGRAAVMGSGPLWLALDATSAIPAVFPPVVVGERVLVDGWMVNPLPVDVLRREGADVVVAVDVTAGADPTMRDGTTPSASASPLRRLGQRLANPAIVRLVMRAMEVAAHERTITSLAVADAAIQPDLLAYSVTDVGRMPEIIERGEAAAEEALRTVRRAFGQSTPTSS